MTLHDLAVFAAGVLAGGIVIGPSVFALLMGVVVPWLAKMAGGI